MLNARRGLPAGSLQYDISTMQHAGNHAWQCDIIQHHLVDCEQKLHRNSFNKHRVCVLPPAMKSKVEHTICICTSSPPTDMWSEHSITSPIPSIPRVPVANPLPCFSQTRTNDDFVYTLLQNTALAVGNYEGIDFGHTSTAPISLLTIGEIQWSPRLFPAASRSPRPVAAPGRWSAVRMILWWYPRATWGGSDLYSASSASLPGSVELVRQGAGG